MVFGSILNLSWVFSETAACFQQKALINLCFLAEMGVSQCSSHTAGVDQHNYTETRWKKFWGGNKQSARKEWVEEGNGFFIYLCFAYCDADERSQQLLAAIRKNEFGSKREPSVKDVPFLIFEQHNTALYMSAFGRFGFFSMRWQIGCAKATQRNTPSVPSHTPILVLWHWTGLELSNMIINPVATQRASLFWINDWLEIYGRFCFICLERVWIIILCIHFFPLHLY